MTKKQILTTLIKVAFLGLLLYFCFQFFIPRWESLQLSDRLKTLSWPWITAAAVFTLAYYVLGFSIWTIILNNLGASPKPYMTARAYVCSFLPKYIPGNVAAHGLRTHLAAQAGVPVMVSMKSFVLEAIFALGTAAAVSVPGAVYYRPEVMDPFFNWLVAAVVLVLIVIVAAKRFKLKYIYELDLTAPHRLRAYVKVFLLYRRARSPDRNGAEYGSRGFHGSRKQGRWRYARQRRVVC